MMRYETKDLSVLHKFIEIRAVYRNPPAPHLEIVYVLDKGYRDVAIGNRVVSIPPFHVALHNVHQGNFTPTMHYLKRIRINQARYLLEHTDLLVEEIAFDVGFTDPFHFSRVFRTLIGLSSRAWRKRQG